MTATGEMPDASLQQCVDLLELALSRPVILEDPMLRPIAYSRQPDDIDGARLRVILHRGVEPEFLRMCHGLGIHTANEPVWTPEVPEWHMEQRLCVPIRRGRRLVAYLWVLAPKGSLSAQQIAVVSGTAEVVANTLDAGRAQRRGAEHNTQLLLARLLDGDRHDGNLLAHLSTNENLPNGATVVVVAFEPPEEATRRGDVIDTALELRERLPGTQLPVRWMVHLADKPAVLAVLGSETQLDELTIATAAQTGLSAYYGVPVAVGTAGGPVAYDDIRGAYRRASVAAWVARRSPRHGPVASWTDIGSWRLLAELIGGRPHRDDLVSGLPPGLTSLLAEERTELIDTLEVYLDSGGDATATASALHLHRSTLYYRIEKIAELTGLSLKDGQTRFELMLGLRVAALLGLRGPTVRQSWE